MQATMQATTTPKMMTWTGRVLSALAILFLVFDGVIKLFVIQPVVDSFATLSYPIHLALWIGIIQLICIAFYAYPRTAILGAILVTGHLGGAIATQLRADAGIFPVVFPMIIGAMLWGGIYLRDARLRRMLPVREAAL